MNWKRYRQRVVVEAPYELRRHPEANRLTWLAALAHLRGRTLIDELVDLLIETIHHIVLAQPKWANKLTPRDLAALTPLIWDHVNPYGRFELDMNDRLRLH